MNLYLSLEVRVTSGHEARRSDEETSFNHSRRDNFPGRFLISSADNADERNAAAS